MSFNNENAKTPQPLVSIIVPVYNGEKLITETLHNLLEQSYQNIELILVNDGSTDNSGEVINELAKSDQRIKAFHKKNGGIASARNFGINKANGKFIALCDQDDFWDCEKLTKQMPLFDNPDIGLVYCCNPKRLSKQHNGRTDWLHQQRGKIFEHLIKGNFIKSIDTVTRKSLLRKVKGFDTDKRLMGVDDWHLWLRLSLITEFDFVPEGLSKHVIHGDNYSRKESLMHEAELTCIDKIKNEPNIHQYTVNWSNIINSIHHRYLKSYINDGDFDDARTTCMQIINNKPWQLVIYIKYLVLSLCSDKHILEIQNIRRKNSKVR